MALALCNGQGILTALNRKDLIYESVQQTHRCRFVICKLQTSIG